MATDAPKLQAPNPKRSVIRWLLDSDPSIRWQAMRDLTDTPDEEVAAERAKVATEGWDASLLAKQTPDGQWGDDPSHPEWTCLLSLLWLRDMGLDPLLVPHRLPLRRSAWARVPAQRGDQAGRACGRGYGFGRGEAWRGRPLAAREPPSRPAGSPDGRSGGQT